MTTAFIEQTPATDRFEGMRKILRFNWPQYASAGAIVPLAAAAAIAGPYPLGVKMAIAMAAACAGFWLAASLVVSHWIYDLSPLYKWDWIDAVLPQRPRRWANIHCGVNDSTPALRRIFAASEGRVPDVFDDREMTEPSIRRARRIARNVEAAETADFRHLPLESGSCDSAFLLLAAHEIRRRRSQERFFAEVFRATRAGGTVVLAEHPRDFWNFLAFGPGFLHFIVRSRWRQLARTAGFQIAGEFSITPFIRVFLLRR